MSLQYSLLRTKLVVHFKKIVHVLPVFIESTLQQAIIKHKFCHLLLQTCKYQSRGVVSTFNSQMGALRKSRSKLGLPAIF